MSKDVRIALVFACRRLLEPLIRILLRSGVSAGEFKSIVDSIYVHQAARHLTKLGEGVNDSRLAIITGLQRHTIGALREKLPDDFTPRSGTQLHRASRVLTGWYEDMEFRTRSGEPRVLPFSGPGATFQALVLRYGGGVPAGPLLKELIQVGVAERLPKKQIRVLRRNPEPIGVDPATLYSLGQVGGDLLNTFDHNLTSSSTAQLPVRTIVAAVDAAALPLFRGQMRKRADGLVEMAESFLESHEPKKPADRVEDSGPKSLTLGVGVFTLMREVEEEPIEPKKSVTKRSPTARKSVKRKK